LSSYKVREKSKLDDLYASCIAESKAYISLVMDDNEKKESICFSFDWF